MHMQRQLTTPRTGMHTQQYSAPRTGMLHTTTCTGLLQSSASKVTVETEPWFNMESTWVQVRG